MMPVPNGLPIWRRSATASAHDVIVIPATEAKNWGLGSQTRTRTYSASGSAPSGSYGVSTRIFTSPAR